MKINYVLAASDLNPMYLDFVPVFIDIWKLLFPEVTPIVILIAPSLPEHLKPYSAHIKIFKPIENVSPAFISQYIRILYPALFPKESTILISDIDMIPMNRSYYEDPIRNIEENKFVTYRDVLIPENQYPICYNIARSSTWSTIFNIQTEEDIINCLKEIYTKIDYNTLEGWVTDQVDLFTKVNEWNSKTNNLIILNDEITNHNRLNRHEFYVTNPIAADIKNGKYTDYHAYRPYNQFLSINTIIFNILNDGLLERQS
jgi:hypothetical protein